MAQQKPTVYISCRVDELANSRRSVIEAALDGACTPLWNDHFAALSASEPDTAETAGLDLALPTITDGQSPRKRIDDLIYHSEFFFGIYADTYGSPEDLFCGHRQIEYEFLLFMLRWRFDDEERHSDKLSFLLPQDQQSMCSEAIVRLAFEKREIERVLGILKQIDRMRATIKDLEESDAPHCRAYDRLVRSAKGEISQPEGLTQSLTIADESPFREHEGPHFLPHLCRKEAVAKISRIVTDLEASLQGSKYAQIFRDRVILCLRKLSGDRPMSSKLFRALRNKPYHEYCSRFDGGSRDHLPAAADLYETARDKIKLWKEYFSRLPQQPSAPSQAILFRNTPNKVGVLRHILQLMNEAGFNILDIRMGQHNGDRVVATLASPYYRQPSSERLRNIEHSLTDAWGIKLELHQESDWRMLHNSISDNPDPKSARGLNFTIDILVWDVPGRMHSIVRRVSGCKAAISSVTLSRHDPETLQDAEPRSRGDNSVWVRIKGSSETLLPQGPAETMRRIVASAKLPTGVLHVKHSMQTEIA